MQEVDTTRECVLVCVRARVCVLAVYSVSACPVWEGGRGGSEDREVERRTAQQESLISAITH